MTPTITTLYDGAELQIEENQPAWLRDRYPQVLINTTAVAVDPQIVDSLRADRWEVVIPAQHRRRLSRLAIGTRAADIAELIPAIMSCQAIYEIDANNHEPFCVIVRAIAQELDLPILTNPPNPTQNDK